MKHIVLILAAALLLPHTATAETTRPSISVTGEASISVPPDTVEIDAGLTTEAKNARDAMEANNTAMGKALLALKSAGVAEKDFQTSRLSLTPQMAQRTPNSQAQQITGYIARNRVTVRLRDVTKVASIIDTLVNAGVNDMGGISFGVSNASKLLDDARAEAIADAKRKAEIYAKAANVTLGSAISISEEGGAPAPVYRSKFAAAPASAPIAQGEETLRIAVSVTYEIKAAQ
ncbi:MAG: hypothetical protein A4S14_19900 [Proteobacteria bacterium SG_bin9]|nr:MAG: hypothetical protein A4S14_19900 [Proteobacteria bacterium SG_bin9]